MAAEKEVVIKAKLDTGDSVSKVNALKKEIKSFDNVKINSLSFEELNKRMDAGKLTMREMTQLIKQYKTIAIEAGFESPVGAEALKRAGELKDRIADSSDAVNRLAADGRKMNTAISIGNTALQGYQAFIGLTQLAGGENKKLMETMAKMIVVTQTLTAVELVATQFRKTSLIWIQAQSMAYKLLGSSASEATPKILAMSKALAASLIGAVLTGLILLVINFKEIVNWITNAWNSIQNFTNYIPVFGQAIKVLDIAFEIIGDAIQWVTELFGGLTREQKKLIETNQAIIDSTDDLVKATESKYGRMIKIADAAGKDTYDLEKQKIKAIIDLYMKQLNAYIAIKQTQGELDEEQLRAALENVEKVKDMLADLQVLEIKHTAKLKEEQDKRKSDYQAYLNSIYGKGVVTETIRGYYDNVINEVNSNMDRLLANMDDAIAKQMAKTTEANNVMVDGAAKSYDRFVEQMQNSREVMRQAQLDIVKNMGDVFSNLAALQNQGSKQQKRLALLGIIASQAESIAQAVLAASKATAKTAGLTGPAAVAVWVATYTSITAGILSAIAQAKRILGEAGGSGSGEARTGGGGGMGANSGNLNGSQQNEQAVMYENKSAPAIVKTVVLESDITKAQNLSNYINKISAL